MASKKNQTFINFSENNFRKNYHKNSTFKTTFANSNITNVNEVFLINNKKKTILSYALDMMEYQSLEYAKEKENYKKMQLIANFHEYFKTVLFLLTQGVNPFISYKHEYIPQKHKNKKGIFVNNDYLQLIYTLHQHTFALSKKSKARINEIQKLCYKNDEHLEANNLIKHFNKIEELFEIIPSNQMSIIKTLMGFENFVYQKTLSFNELSNLNNLTLDHLEQKLRNNIKEITSKHNTETKVKAFLSKVDLLDNIIHYLENSKVKYNDIEKRIRIFNCLNIISNTFYIIGQDQDNEVLNDNLTSYKKTIKIMSEDIKNNIISNKQNLQDYHNSLKFYINNINSDIELIDTLKKTENIIFSKEFLSNKEKPQNKKKKMIL